MRGPAGRRCLPGPCDAATCRPACRATRRGKDQDDDAEPIDRPLPGHSHAARAMLRRTGDGAAVIACNTCRQSAEAREGADGVRGGARLVAALHAAKAADPRYAGIAIEEMPCLFACTEHCTVHLRAPDKVGYVMGRFAPDAEAATAILDYAVHYAESPHGSVAYKLWPQGVKGHFITRTPPAGFVVA